MPAPLANIDATLNRSGLGDTPKALLLLKLCQTTRSLRPDAFPGFLEQLQGVAFALPATERAAYEALVSVESSSAAGEAGGFAGAIAGDLEEAVGKVDSDRAGAIEQVQACEARLRSRWWWPFGRGPAWLAIASAWASIDREVALGLLPKLASTVQASFVEKLHGDRKLTAQEWTLAHENMADSCIVAVIRELLDDGAEGLTLPEPLARTVADVLRDEAVREAGETKKREKVLVLYKRLGERVAQSDPQLAEELARKLFVKMAHAYPRIGAGGQFTKVFSALRQVIILWAELGLEVDGTADHIASRSPGHLKAFALAQWHGMTCADDGRARLAYATLMASTGSNREAEAWFLVVLVRRGMGTVAMELAAGSSAGDRLVQRLRRAWVASDAPGAREELQDSDFEDDEIGRFLLMPSQDERVAWLRDATSRGCESLPRSFWRRPTITDVIQDREHEALMATYSKETDSGDQFGVYLRLHGYGHWSYESLDPLLLETLCRWADEHPGEVDGVLTEMWKAMEPPDDAYLMLDLLRNVVFERCRTLFAARPERLFDLFLGWVKRKLVDGQVRITNYTEGTVRTLSLSDEAPFLYALMGAEEVGKPSPARCDAILMTAMKRYTSSSELVSAAAQLYASDKGLDALEELPAGLSGDQREALQLAIVRNAARTLLLSMLLQGLQGEDAETPEA